MHRISLCAGVAPFGGVTSCGLAINPEGDASRDTAPDRTTVYADVTVTADGTATLFTTRRAASGWFRRALS